MAKDQKITKLHPKKDTEYWLLEPVYAVIFVVALCALAVVSGLYAGYNIGQSRYKRVLRETYPYMANFKDTAQIGDLFMIPDGLLQWDGEKYIPLLENK